MHDSPLLPFWSGTLVQKPQSFMAILHNPSYRSFRKTLDTLPPCLSQPTEDILGLIFTQGEGESTNKQRTGEFKYFQLLWK